MLEVGTGSGYQTAVLAELAGKVCSIEVIPALADGAAAALAAQGYANVELRTGDGGLGWPEHAPFDAIIVTAAAPDVPPALVEQLRRGGRMVIPVGPPHGDQELMLITKDADGNGQPAQHPAGGFRAVDRGISAWHRSIRVCFFGDSFVNGTGDDACLGWVGRACAAGRRRGVDLTCYNLGIRRDTSADVPQRWEREAQARLPPEHDGRLVFSFGANDCCLTEDGSGVRVPPSRRSPMPVAFWQRRPRGAQR